MGEQKELPMFLESAEVVEVVGILPTLLNKFVEQREYGIAPSIRAGKGRGSRRLFSEHDVYGVALVWWLFEAGLRAQTIRYILHQLCPRKEVTANAAALLLDEEDKILVIRREPRTATPKRRRPEQEVIVADWTSATHLVETSETASVLFIPVADRFEKLREAMRTLSPLTKKFERSK